MAKSSRPLTEKHEFLKLFKALTRKTRIFKAPRGLDWKKSENPKNPENPRKSQKDPENPENIPPKKKRK